ncbi:hypothetical protein HAX54_013809, partial [Datura stramonium]|nr:hypothetical protein [Datura stramonium]
GGENIDFQCTSRIEEQVVKSSDESLSDSKSNNDQRMEKRLLVVTSQVTSHKVSHTVQSLIGFGNVQFLVRSLK